MQRNRIIMTTVFFVGLARVSSAGEPLDLVKSAGERAIAVLKDPKLKSPDKKKERVERLKEIINPIFDYDEMARRALGAHWRRRTPAEQEEFARLFRAFLERIYSDKVDLYDGERIVFGRETIDQEYAQVESTVVNAKGQESSVVYRLKRADGKWKVYDAGRKYQYRQQLPLAVRSRDLEIVLRRTAEDAQGKSRITGLSL
jgi:phospholipid transport system substrate-binding protein